jgi:hypothetical protein
LSVVLDTNALVVLALDRQRAVVVEQQRGLPVKLIQTR